MALPSVCREVAADCKISVTPCTEELNVDSTVVFANKPSFDLEFPCGNSRKFSRNMKAIAMLRALALLSISAVCVRATEPYGEQYRPQYHFSPKLNWTNDPCGLVYASGSYHLFFQHNPTGNLWGHMSWGHALSPNLVRWTQLPVAIPEGPDAAIFTGSSVVDVHNSSGLCTRGRACIVSIYTGYVLKSGAQPARQHQNLAVSQDGISWTKYSGNPVLDIQMADFRDPKVFWHAPTGQWIMVVMLPLERKSRIYGSSNLKNWKHLSDFGPAGATGGDWECPDLFQLPVDGAGNKKRWVLKIGLNPGHLAGGSGEQYFIGEFDGVRFRNENSAAEIRWLDYGRDCYCALTFNGEPAQRPTHMIGWMSNWQYARATPTDPWRGSMTLPRSLELRTFHDRLQLIQRPVHELSALRTESFTYQGASAAELNRRLAQWPHRGQAFEITAAINMGASKQIAWKLLEASDEYTLVGYDAAAKQLFVDRTKSAHTAFSAQFPSRTSAPLDLEKKQLKLHIFVDRSSIEVFGGDGQVVLTNLVYPKPDSAGISLKVDGSELESIRVDLWNLRSIWTAQAK